MFKREVSVTIRKAEETDLDIIRELFSNCVMTVCANDYTSDQRKVWASSALDRGRWLAKIQSQFFLVAERDETIVGFGSLEGHDSIDLLYVHQDYQRTGIADKILNALLSKLKADGITFVKADVSKTASAFFESRGFRVVREQTVNRNNIALINFRMEKDL